MRRRFAALISAVAVASALGFAAPTHPSAAQLPSCTVTSEEDFTPGVQTTPVVQGVRGKLQGPAQTAGPACANAVNGITDVDATFSGRGPATCFTDPILATVDLSGTMTITWKRANGETVGSSGARWTARQVDLGNVVLAGAVSSGLFAGATVSVSGLSADGVIRVTGGCRPGSPLTGARTTDTYLRLTRCDAMRGLKGRRVSD